MSQYLALDVGATHTRCLVVDESRAVTARVRRSTPQETTAAAFGDRLGETVRATLAAGDLRASAIDAAAVASFGPLDTTAGTIRKTPNLASELTDVPVREPVADQLPAETPVAVLNDAVAGVIAEHRRGETENVVYLTLSSGVGAGVVLDGSVLQGRHGNAAEIGHLILEPNSDRRCGCGGRGHWEAFAGGENVPGYAREIAAGEGLSTDLPLDGELSTAMLFEAYGADRLATETIDRVGEWNAIGVANLVHAFAPDRIAVGGALALENPALVVEPIVRSLDDRLTVERPAIHLTEFGDEVVVRGAAEHAIELAR